MSWSYDESLPTAKDRVRVLVGDTDENDPLISDEGIAMYLSGGALEQTSERLAAAEVATAIAAKFARKATSLSAGGTSVNWGDLAKRYRDLAEQLRATDAAGDGTGLFDIAEFALDSFSVREIALNAALRSGL